MNAVVLAISILWPALSHAGFPCEHSPGGLLRAERAVLNAKDAPSVAEPLSCMLEIHEKSPGSTRYLAASALRALLGGGQIAGVMKDARYKRVAEALEQLTLKSGDPLRRSVIAEYARGDWAFYKLFCEEGNTEFCAAFLPDEKSLRQESPLLAAASLVRLKNAYHALQGEQRREVEIRLKKLYREIPVAQKLQRKFIDQIYHELFLTPPLSRA